MHGEHCSRSNLLGELLVKHLDGSITVFVAHADRGRVLRRCLADHEHRYALVGQSGEDAAVDTDDTYHRQTGDSDKGGALDAADTLDGLAVVFDLLLYQCSGMAGVEGVFNLDGYVLYTYGIYRGRINDLCAEVAKLHSLYIR